MTTPTDAKFLIDNLRKMGLTLRDIASRVGVSASAIYRLREDEGRRPRESTRKALVSVYAARIRELKAERAMIEEALHD